MFTLAFNLLLNIALLGADQSFVRMFYEKPEEERRNLLWESLMPSLSVGIIILLLLAYFEGAIFCSIWRFYSFSSYLLLGFTILIGVIERFATLAVRMKKEE